MSSIIGPIILGVFISVLGIMNMRGNISSLHWYHRQRVSEEDRLSFGKLVGFGTLVIGISIILFGCFCLFSEILKNSIYTTIGSVVVIIGIIVGIVLSFYAMIKYNKGIF